MRFNSHLVSPQTYRPSKQASIFISQNTAHSAPPLARGPKGERGSRMGSILGNKDACLLNRGAKYQILLLIISTPTFGTHWRPNCWKIHRFSLVGLRIFEILTDIC